MQGAGTDPDTGDTITSYTWTQTDPTTPSLIAGAENRQNPSFLASDAGVYTFSLVVNDGDADSAPSTVVVTITPNQPATFTGALTGSITEDGTTAISGTITVDDADDANEARVQTDEATTYGTFSITAAGVWSYTLNNAHADVNALAAGDTLIDTITVRAADDTVGTITITINGVNDAPVIAASVSTLNAVAGTAIVPVTISSTGGTVARYAISPAIENGLIFSTATGTISGTPTDAATVVMYRITATNTAGDDTAAVDITVPNSYSATSTVLATSSTNSEGLAVITLGQTSGNNIEATRATITLPSGLSGATITVATLADDSQALPAAQPEETVADSQRSLVDIDVTGDNSNTISRTNPVTICLPYGELANPGLYHAAVTGAEAVWGLLPSQRVETNPNLVCGDATGFSPFAVFGNMRSLDAVAETQVLNAVLPQLLRATTKITVDNISNRIDQALDASASTDTRLNLGGSSTLQELINNNARTVLESELDVKQMLNNSSFLIPLNVAGDNNYGVNNMTLWGSGDYLNLSDDVFGVDWEGEIVGGSVGIDARLSQNLVAGAAVSYSEGDIDYKREDSANNSKGTLTNTLYSIHPYLGYDLSQGGRVWGTFGYGQGEVEIREQGTSTDKTSHRDTELRSLAFGGNRDLSSSDSWLNLSGTTTLRLKGEVSLSNIKVDKSDLTDAKALSIDAHRYRMALEGSHNHTLASGASISPSIELGIRYDDGSGETGGGVELAGSYRYSNPQGLEMELRAHGLLAHESSYQEWGLSGLVTAFITSKLFHIV
ncbi:MAG: autotransporter domain-containing protein [Nitrosopumilus sp.]|nr:autotransporter domain-containing protein [Nitrosopumilus sp.]